MQPKIPFRRVLNVQLNGNGLPRCYKAQINTRNPRPGSLLESAVYYIDSRRTNSKISSLVRSQGKEDRCFRDAAAIIRHLVTNRVIAAETQLLVGPPDDIPVPIADPEVVRRMG